jgi:hypothetical protein
MNLMNSKIYNFGFTEPKNMNHKPNNSLNLVFRICSMSASFVTKFQDRRNDESIILEYILKKLNWTLWQDSFDSVQGPMAGSCEHGSGPSFSRKI